MLSRSITICRGLPAALARVSDRSREAEEERLQGFLSSFLFFGQSESRLKGGSRNPSFREKKGPVKAGHFAFSDSELSG